MSKTCLGILGGGQLGSLLAQAAKKLNIKTVVYCDDPDAPAKYFADDFIIGNYDEHRKITEFIKKIDLVTFEFENIPYDILSTINQKKKVLPNPNTNQILQNRFTEKKFINDLGLKTTDFVLIKNFSDLRNNTNLFPGILKTCTLGYDGKGQYMVSTIEQIERQNISFNNQFIFEKKVNLEKEISVILTRYGKNKFEIYEPIENFHKNQILSVSEIPAKINKVIYDQSILWSQKIAEKLDFTGTMCVEFFLDKDNTLLVNEIAPRVHNSGHLTLNSHNVSQFENHIRAVCGLQQVSTKKIHNAKMINLIGEDILIYKSKKFKNNEFFYDYKKKVLKNKRKMGHLTILEDKK